MILSVTLNPCVHHILAYRGGAEGGVVRTPVRSFFQPGGKGLNASRVAAALGAEVTALAPCGGMEGELFLREVRRSGVRVEPVRIRRPTRFSTCLYDLEGGTFLELLEPGVELSDEEVEALFRRFEALLPRADRVALSGSSPCPRTDAFYGEAVRAARRAGVPAAVDTYGEALALAVETGPELVKVNREELARLFGREHLDDAALVEGARRLRDMGTARLVVTDGARGAWAFEGERAFRIRVPSVREIHAVGSGDAVFGALLARLEAGDTLEDACRWGAAAGTVNAGRLEVCAFDPGLVEELIPRVTVEAVRTQGSALHGGGSRRSRPLR